MINSIQHRLIPEPVFNKRTLLIEIGILLVVALLYGGSLLSLDPNSLQQTGEHNEGATLAILADKAIHEHGEIPLWNPYMMTGIPHSGDPLTQFFNPISALSYTLFGAVPGLRISVLISLFVAGVGQLVLGYVLNLKPIVRLWSALLFMLSGGLVLMWRIGTYGFIIGAAWFPACLAFALWAFETRRGWPMVLAAVSIAMLFLSGLVYWSIFFLGCMLLITLIMLISSRRRSGAWIESRQMVLNIGLVAVLALCLVMVYLLPMTDALTSMVKENLGDPEQKNSQPIVYALVNYFVPDFDFYISPALGKAPSGSWFYIGITPILLMAFVAAAFVTKKEIRWSVLLLGALTLFLLAWEANRHNAFKIIYDALPWLYSLRFPQRVLLLAASPLIALSGFGLGYVFDQVSSLKGSIGFSPSEEAIQAGPARRVSVSKILELGLITLLIFSLYDVYKTNQEFGFAARTLNSDAEAGMAWLKEYDDGVYYVKLGNSAPLWSWTPAAYDYEHKVINFGYGRVLSTWRHQLDPLTPIRATPKYIFAYADNAPEPPAELISSFNNVNLYQIADSLPYAFLIGRSLVAGGTPVISTDVQAVQVHLDGPNRIVVTATSSGDGADLIVLESYYPGWKLYVDDQAQDVQQIGDYLGVNATPGNHTYVFSFEPAKYTWGLIITLITLIAIVGWLSADSLRHGRTKPATGKS